MGQTLTSEASLKLRVKRAGLASQRSAKGLAQIRPTASRHDPDHDPERDDQFVVDENEDDPESPGTNSHPASRRLLNHFLVGKGLALDACRLRIPWGNHISRRHTVKPRKTSSRFPLTDQPVADAVDGQEAFEVVAVCCVLRGSSALEQGPRQVPGCFRKSA